MSTKPAFQKMLKGIFHTEEEEKQSQTQKVRKDENTKRK
jgi:hypothetical protein